MKPILCRAGLHRKLETVEQQTFLPLEQCKICGEEGFLLRLNRKTIIAGIVLLTSFILSITSYFY